MSIAMLKCLQPSVSIAAETGRFVSRQGVVIIESSGNGYEVSIETQEGQSTCSLYGPFTEFEEGDLRLTDGKCKVRVYQRDEKILSVTETGCESSCGVGATLNIRRAVRQ